MEPRSDVGSGSVKTRSQQRMERAGQRSSGDAVTKEEPKAFRRGREVPLVCGLSDSGVRQLAVDIVIDSIAACGRTVTRGRAY